MTNTFLPQCQLSVASWQENLTTILVLPTNCSPILFNVFIERSWPETMHS